LLAAPSLDSPLLEQGVVLICEHSSAGTYGLLINKPIDVEIPEELLDLDRASNSRAALRAGGPLRSEQVMILHTGELGSSHSLLLMPGVVLGGDLPFLEELLQHPDQPPVLICFGYCSWCPGQLERDLLEGEWHLAKGSARELFEQDPLSLWSTLLRHHGGKAAALSAFPQDLSLN